MSTAAAIKGKAQASREPAISITKTDLERAFAGWEQDYRDGKCMTHDAADQMSVEQISKLAADHFWDRLHG